MNQLNTGFMDAPLFKAMEKNKVGYCKQECKLGNPGACQMHHNVFRPCTKPRTVQSRTLKSTKLSTFLNRRCIFFTFSSVFFTFSSRF